MHDEEDIKIKGGTYLAFLTAFKINPFYGIFFSTPNKFFKPLIEFAHCKSVKCIWHEDIVTRKM